MGGLDSSSSRNGYTGQKSLLEWIERYNQEDCLSTLRLLDWLIARRAECEQKLLIEIPGSAWRMEPAQ